MYSSQIERRTIATARHMTTYLKSIFTSMTTMTGVLSSSVHDRVDDAGTISDAMFRIYSSAVSIFVLLAMEQKYFMERHAYFVEVQSRL